jgi:hypothetical protein
MFASAINLIPETPFDAEGNRSTRIVLPIPADADMAELGLLVTLLMTKGDRIYLMLQGGRDRLKEDVEADALALQNKLRQMIVQMDIVPGMDAQIEVRGVRTPKELSQQVMKLLGNRRDETAQDKMNKGIASRNQADFEFVKALPWITKLKAEKLKHPYAIAAIAMAFLRDAAAAQLNGSVLDLGIWMEQNNLSLEFEESIRLAAETLQRFLSAA